MHQRSRRVFQLFVSVGLDNSLTCINFTFKNNLKRILLWALPEAKSSSIIANEIVWTGWPSQLFHVHNFRNTVNLEPRVLRLLGQRWVAGENSGDTENRAVPVLVRMLGWWKTEVIEVIHEVNFFQCNSAIIWSRKAVFLLSGLISCFWNWSWLSI